MNNHQNLIKLLQPISKVGSKTYDSLSLAEPLSGLLSKLLPDNTLVYDTECIEDLDDYIYLTHQYASISGGDWIISEIEVKGDFNNSIDLSFSSNNKKITWKINQDGSDYVSEEYLTELLNYCTSNLSGRFVTIPTGDQMIAVVYLPKDIAKKFRALITHYITIDSACYAIKNRADIKDQEWFDNALHTTQELLQQRDSDGDTIFTAALRSGDKQYAGYIKNFANLVTLGFNNQTPYKIAIDNNMNEIADELLEMFTEKASTWEAVMSSLDTDFASANNEVTQLLDKLSNSKIKDTLYPSTFSFTGTMSLGIKPEYLLGDNTVTLYNHKDRIYLVLSITGSNNYYSETICDHEEALTLIDQYLYLTENYLTTEIDPTETMIQRIREYIQTYDDISEKNMFGGLVFISSGKTCVGVISNQFMVRVDKENFQDTLKRPFTREMHLKGKPLKGFVCIEPEGIEQDSDLHRWIDRSLMKLS